jgi:hypothetical protein
MSFAPLLDCSGRLGSGWGKNKNHRIEEEEEFTEYIHYTKSVVPK